MIKTKASSPDELALINFAKLSGYEYIGTDDNNKIIIKARGETHEYELLHTLEFSSKRKRMSVIVRNKNNEIILYSKGADSVLIEKVNKSKSFFLFFLI